MEKPLSQCRILVTPTSYAKDDPELRTQLEAVVGQVQFNNSGKPLSAIELVEIVPGIDGYIAGLDEINRQVIEAGDSLKVISRYGVGVDRVDLQAAKDHSIVVTNTPAANSASVAELTIGLILSLARNIPVANQETKSGNWPRMSGVSLEGKVIGLVGFGAIGRGVAKRLAGFDCKTIAYDPVENKTIAKELSVELLPLDQVVCQSDFLSLHCPLNEDTRNLIGVELIKCMKTGSYLINTSRGELVDEIALYHALVDQKLRGAALDAFSEQPPNKNNPLLILPQVVVSPHAGSHTDGATNAMGWGALKDCLAVLRGEQPAHRVV